MVYADRPAKCGYDLILVARNEHLQNVDQCISQETGRSVRTIVADLSEQANLLRVEVTLREDDNITMLVNNADVGSVHPVLHGDVDNLEATLELNVVALTRLTYAVAPRFAVRNDGTIINIASVVGITVELLNSVLPHSRKFIRFAHRPRKRKRS